MRDHELHLKDDILNIVSGVNICQVVFDFFILSYESMRYFFFVKFCYLALKLTFQNIVQPIWSMYGRILRVVGVQIGLFQTQYINFFFPFKEAFFVGIYARKILISCYLATTFSSHILYDFKPKPIDIGANDIEVCYKSKSSKTKNIITKRRHSKYSILIHQSLYLFMKMIILNKK